MARIELNPSQGVDTGAISVTGLLDTSSYVHSDTRFGVKFANGFHQVLDGKNFSYDRGHELSGGVVHAISASFYNQNIYKITGISISAATLASAAKTASNADDYRMFKAAFSGNDVFIGSNKLDTMYGWDGNDRMFGNDGTNFMDGGAGNDWLEGGSQSNGTDRMVGGLGADTFRFRGLSENLTSADRIIDFSSRQNDIIDVKSIDADSTVTGNQAFDFIGTNEFNHIAGELRLVRSSNETRILFDVDGDAVADFFLKLMNEALPREGDFAL